MSKRVEICGGIASGKTTLAGVLDTVKSEATFEDFQSNPFWKLFYADPARYAFETEVTFLLQHFNQIKIATDRGGLFACDFSFLLDLGYADVNLSGGQYETFLAVYQEVQRSLSKPALVVHLRCGAHEELARIRGRRRPEERAIDTEYLSAINAVVERRVAEVADEVSVLDIDSERNDFANDPVTQERVMQRVLAALKRVT